MLLEEFYNLPSVHAGSFQSGDMVQKVSGCDTAERSRPNFVRLPYTEECSSMDETEIRLDMFGGLTAYGTIHDDCVFLDHPLYFTLPFRRVQVGIVPADSRAPPPERGPSFLIVLIRALFPVLGRFCIYNGRFSARRNEQEPQEKRASKRVLLGSSLLRS